MNGYLQLSHSLPTERFVEELLSKVWRCLLWGGELKVTIHVAPIENTESLVERCARSRDQLREVIKSQMETISLKALLSTSRS